MMPFGSKSLFSFFQGPQNKVELEERPVTAEPETSFESALIATPGESFAVELESRPQVRPLAVALEVRASDSEQVSEPAEMSPFDSTDAGSDTLVLDDGLWIPRAPSKGSPRGSSAPRPLAVDSTGATPTGSNRAERPLTLGPPSLESSVDVPVELEPLELQTREDLAIPVHAPYLDAASLQLVGLSQTPVDPTVPLVDRPINRAPERAFFASDSEGVELKQVRVEPLAHRLTEETPNEPGFLRSPATQEAVKLTAHPATPSRLGELQTALDGPNAQVKTGNLQRRLQARYLQLPLSGGGKVTPEGRADPTVPVSPLPSSASELPPIVSSKDVNKGGASTSLASPSRGPDFATSSDSLLVDSSPAKERPMPGDRPQEGTPPMIDEGPTLIPGQDLSRSGEVRPRSHGDSVPVESSPMRLSERMTLPTLESPSTLSELPTLPAPMSQLPPAPQQPGRRSVTSSSTLEERPTLPTLDHPATLFEMPTLPVDERPSLTPLSSQVKSADTLAERPTLPVLERPASSADLPTVQSSIYRPDELEVAAPAPSLVPSKEGTLVRPSSLSEERTVILPSKLSEAQTAVRPPGHPEAPTMVRPAGISPGQTAVPSVSTSEAKDPVGSPFAARGTLQEEPTVVKASTRLFSDRVQSEPSAELSRRPASPSRPSREPFAKAPAVREESILVRSRSGMPLPQPGATLRSAPKWEPGFRVRRRPTSTTNPVSTSVEMLREKPDPRPGAPLKKAPASPIPDPHLPTHPAGPDRPTRAAVRAPALLESPIEDALIEAVTVELPEDRSFSEIPLKAKTAAPIQSATRGAPGGDPLTTSLQPLSVGGETNQRSRVNDEPIRGGEGVFLESMSAGGRDMDGQEHPVSARSTTDALDASDPSSVAVAMGGEGSGADLSQGERGSSEQQQRAPEAKEVVPMETPGKEGTVVARLDESTKVEVTVRPEGVEVLLDTTAAEVARFEGLEDELRTALRYGDADLLNYEAREETGKQPTEKHEGSRRKTHHERGAEEAEGERSNTPILRGSLLNTIA